MIYIYIYIGPTGSATRLTAILSDKVIYKMMNRRGVSNKICDKIFMKTCCEIVYFCLCHLLGYFLSADKNTFSLLCNLALLMS